MKTRHAAESTAAKDLASQPPPSEPDTPDIPPVPIRPAAPDAYTLSLERQLGLLRERLTAAREGDLDARLASGLRDIKEENGRLRLQLHEAIKARDEFLSVASHELRTPLTPLILHLQRLLSEGGVEPLEAMDPPRLRLLLRRILSQAQRLGTLVETLLDVSLASADCLDLHVEEIDLSTLVAGIARRFNEDAWRRGASINVQITGDARGDWDRLRLEQLFTSLFDNALKYGRGAPVEVELESRDDSAIVRVRDHGIGIEPEKLGRIFERFERGVSVQSYGGLGLGLYVARRIVLGHGGQIRVSSTPGIGSVFTVVLPRSPAQALLPSVKRLFENTPTKGTPRAAAGDSAP